MPSSRRNSSVELKPKKLHKIEEYAMRAKALQAERQMHAQRTSYRAAGGDSPRLDMRRGLVLRSSTLDEDWTPVTVEEAREVLARRSVEEPINLSLDVRSSTICFSAQRSIDIGLWAQGGGGFQIKARSGGWYQKEAVIGLQKFLRANFGWQTLEMISVLFALFLADFLELLQVPGNMTQDLILTSVFGIFATELIGLTISDLSYPFSFFFWMDVIGTMSMITDISFMLGKDAAQPYRMANDFEGEGAGKVVSVRIARATMLGERAARLSRVLKVMKYVAVFTRDEVKKDDEVKMAKVISNQLNDVLATRVAFFTICIASAIPCFAMFNYPEMDGSMGAWTSTISRDAESYRHALEGKNQELIGEAKKSILSELTRFAKFYEFFDYGPFQTCFGDSRLPGGPNFECHNQGHLDLSFSSSFTAPTRTSSVWIVEGAKAQAYFTMEEAVKFDAAGNMMLVLFVILTMMVFSVIMNNSVSIIALHPLEHLLSIVRERCAQIFKFTSALQESKGHSKEETEHDEYTMMNNEFVLLENAVSKLAAIANLHAKPEPEVNEKMEEQDMLVLNMQGVQVPSDNDARRALSLSSHSGASGSLPSFGASSLFKRSICRNSLTKEEDILDIAYNKIPADLLNLMDTWDFNAFELLEGGSARDPSRQYSPSGRTSQGSRASSTSTQSQQLLGSDVGPERESSELVIEGLPKSRTSDFDELKDTTYQEKLRSWVTIHIMGNAPGCNSFVLAMVSGDVLQNFVNTTKSEYLANPYHNFAHAIDVCWCVARYIALIDEGMSSRCVSEVAQFWLMVAALGHDIGHEGLSNAYLAEISHPLSLTYNDRSPLENMHCAALFQILQDAKTNVFIELDKVVYKDVRKGIIGAILHTDITKHSELVKTIALFYQMNSDVVDAQNADFYMLLQSSQYNQTILNTFLHTADVGNPMKPWHLCEMLSYRVMEEFFAQGELEKLHGIPVAMLNDATKVNIPNSQIGFIEFMITPLVESVVMIFPSLGALAQNLAVNMHNWLDDWNEMSTPPPEALEKAAARVEKVRLRMLDVAPADDEDY